MVVDPDDPAAQAVRQAARGIVALSPIALPILQVRAPAPPAQAAGMSLPMVS
jgi:ATP-binding protein involved in chromosome partitioning